LETIQQALGWHKVLIILDQCEHAVKNSLFKTCLAQILQNTRHVKFLFTSTEATGGMPGFAEYVQELKPLEAHVSVTLFGLLSPHPSTNARRRQLIMSLKKCVQAEQQRLATIASAAAISHDHEGLPSSSNVGSGDFAWNDGDERYFSGCSSSNTWYWRDSVLAKLLAGNPAQIAHLAYDMPADRFLMLDQQLQAEVIAIGSSPTT
jgi:hypothetical protein